MDEEKAFLITQCDSLADALEDFLNVTDGDGENTKDDPDEDSIGSYGDGTPLPMTFGHIRRAKKALESYRDAPYAPPPGYALVKLEGAEERVMDAVEKCFMDFTGRDMSALSPNMAQAAIKAMVEGE